MFRLRISSVVLLLSTLCVAADNRLAEPCPGRRPPSPEPLRRATRKPLPLEPRLFADHCSKCHGADALGRGKRPSLRSKEVQTATDGEIFWLLKNGNRRRGMPSWSSLPEPSRWQLVAYVKSLGESIPDNKQP